MFQISGTTTVVTISEALNQSTRNITTITGTSTSSTTTTTPTTTTSKLESAICNTTYSSPSLNVIVIFFEISR